MKYLTNAKIYRNSDEIFPDQTQFDYTLVSPLLSSPVSIGSKEAAVWHMLQRGKPLAEIATLLSMESKQYEDRYLDALIHSWLELGLIYPQGQQIPQIKQTFWQKLNWRQINLPETNAKVQAIYQKFGHYFFTHAGLIFMVVIIFSGLASLLVAIVQNKYAPLIQGSGLSLLLTLPLTLISLTLHELGHALTMAHFGAEVVRGGVALYLGLPVFFVDSSTMWAKPKWQRIIVSGGGMAVNLLIASIAVFWALLLPPGFITTLLWELSAINLFMLAFSLIPFLKMDGYFILIDLVGVPHLDDKAAHDLHEFLRSPTKFVWNRRTLMMLAYAVITGLASLALTVYSVFYWLRVIRIVSGL